MFRAPRARTRAAAAAAAAAALSLLLGAGHAAAQGPATFEITSVKYVDPYQADVGVTYSCAPDYGSDPNVFVRVDHSAGGDFSEGGTGGMDVQCDGQSHMVTVRAEGDREWVCEEPGEDDCFTPFTRGEEVDVSGALQASREPDDSDSNVNGSLHGVLN